MSMLARLKTYGYKQCFLTGRGPDILYITRSRREFTEFFHPKNNFTARRRSFSSENGSGDRLEVNHPIAQIEIDQVYNPRLKGGVADCLKYIFKADKINLMRSCSNYKEAFLKKYGLRGGLISGFLKPKVEVKSSRVSIVAKASRYKPCLPPKKRERSRIKAGTTVMVYFFNGAYVIGLETQFTEEGPIPKKTFDEVKERVILKRFFVLFSGTAKDGRAAAGLLNKILQSREHSNQNLISACYELRQMIIENQLLLDCDLFVLDSVPDENPSIIQMNMKGFLIDIIVLPAETSPYGIGSGSRIALAHFKKEIGKVQSLTLKSAMGVMQKSVAEATRMDIFSGGYSRVYNTKEKKVWHVWCEVSEDENAWHIQRRLKYI